VTEAEAAQILIEGTGAQHLDKKVSVLATRMMLQVFSVPSLMAYLADASSCADRQTGRQRQGSTRFHQAANGRGLTGTGETFSTDYFKEHKLLKYIKNGQARTGWKSKSRRRTYR
jgi:hypothetical protein